MMLNTDYENANTTTGNGQRGKLLLDATKQFCHRMNNNKQSDKDQFIKLFYSLVADTEHSTRKIISSILARHCYTPRPIAYYLAMEDPDIATPFLLISPVLWERDLIQLISKLKPSSLTVIARRADITKKLAKELISRGDKTVCKMLSQNTSFKPDQQMSDDMELILSGNLSEPQTEIAAEIARADARNELLKLASIGSNIKRKSKLPSKVSADKIISKPFADRMLELAELKEVQKIASAIALRIEISVDNISKLMTHENGTSFIIFLKGLNFSRFQASRLLLLVNKQVARNNVEFTNSMEQFDRFSIVQCQDMMKNLGAKNIASSETSNNDYQVREALSNAGFERRQQIFARPSPALFGTKRKAG